MKLYTNIPDIINFRTDGEFYIEHNIADGNFYNNET